MDKNLDCEMFPELEGWVSATDAADELGVRRQSMNKMIHGRKFKTVHRIGNRFLVVERDELDQIKAQRSAREDGAVG